MFTYNLCWYISQGEQSATRSAFLWFVLIIDKSGTNSAVECPKGCLGKFNSIKSRLWVLTYKVWPYVAVIPI